MFSFWPGYRGLAQYGLWSQLAVSLLFALFLDAFLVSCFFWTDVVSATRFKFLVPGLLMAWSLLMIVAGLGRKRFEALLAADEKDETFRKATVHYLRGNWFETESILIPALKKNPRDIEAMLLLATLYRHTKRYSEALVVLRQLEHFDGAGRWFLEIHEEHRLIRTAINEDAAALEQATPEKRTPCEK